MKIASHFTFFKQTKNVFVIVQHKSKLKVNNNYRTIGSAEKATQTQINIIYPLPANWCTTMTPREQ